MTGVNKKISMAENSASSFEEMSAPKRKRFKRTVNGSPLERAYIIIDSIGDGNRQLLMHRQGKVDIGAKNELESSDLLHSTDHAKSSGDIMNVRQ